MNTISDCNSQTTYSHLLQEFRTSFLCMTYIHTGIKPGNRKPKTYFNYLLSKGYDTSELQQLAKAALLNELP